MGTKDKQLMAGDLVSPIRGNTTALGIVIHAGPNLRYVAVRWFMNWKVSSHMKARDLILISRAHKP